MSIIFLLLCLNFICKMVRKARVTSLTRSEDKWPNTYKEPQMIPAQVRPPVRLVVMQSSEGGGPHSGLSEAEATRGSSRIQT